MQNFEHPYDLNLSLEQNIEKGPPQIPDNMKIPESTWIEWLGIPLKSPFGISACPLTMNSQWVQWAASLGYDVLTFKTVRSREWKVNPYPNWVYADENSFDKESNQIAASLDPYKAEEVSMGNSFGVQSASPEIWIKEYESAKSMLTEGQELILSVMPSVIEGVDIFDDMDKLAELANRTSAKRIEINYACPNSNHNLIYLDIDLMVALSKRFRSKLNQDKFLIIKVSYYPNQNDIRTLTLNTRGIINGITSINTMGMRLEDNNNPFGTNRPTAGFSGAVIRPFAIEQMENFIKAREELGLVETLGLIAIGGVTMPEHIHKYRTMAKNKNIIVQAAVGVWENPGLAIDFKESCKEQ